MTRLYEVSGENCVTTTTHLNKGRHVRFLHGLNGRLHQRYGGLQLVAVALDERPGAFEFVVLLLADEPHQLQLPLLQGRRQAVKMAGQLFPLPLSILLRSEVRGRISLRPNQSFPCRSPLWRGTSLPSGRRAPGCGRCWLPARRSRRSAPPAKRQTGST